MVPTPDRLPTGPLTYQDYVELPEDGRRYEIIEGDLDVSPSPMVRHQIVVTNLLLLLATHVRERSLGLVVASPVDLILSETNVVVPDLMFISTQRRSVVTARAVEGVPDLAIEIISPSSERKDRSTKALLYARFGVPHYWILDPEQRTFEAFVLDGATYRLASRGEDDATVRAEPFPDLAITLTTVWSEP